MIRAVEAAALELDRDSGEHLAQSLLPALGAGHQRVVSERLHLLKIVSAVLATVTVRRHWWTPFV